MNYQRHVSPQTQFYQVPHPFILESGVLLEQVQIAYRTWGTLDSSGSNAVLVCHAFTGSADVDRWWDPLLGKGRALDPQENFIVCSNILGSCYGTTGPTSINPRTGKPYGPNFPDINIRDMVRLQHVLIKALGIKSLRLVIGGSLGGMQVLEWALLYRDEVEVIAVIAASGKHSAWCIGLSEAQRQAIYADPAWQGGYYLQEQPPSQGLAIARMIAMVTYRSWQSFNERFARQRNENFAIANYLNYQGQKLVERFDPNTYITLSRAMDHHDVTRGDQSYESVLRSIQQPTLIVAIESDILYPVIEQQELASLIPNSQLLFLNSYHGHDAFLMDMEELNNIVVFFQERIRVNSRIS